MLKLNYEEVLSTLSDRGPLYTDDDCYLLPLAALAAATMLLLKRFIIHTPSFCLYLFFY